MRHNRLLQLLTVIGFLTGGAAPLLSATITVSDSKSITILADSSFDANCADFNLTAVETVDVQALGVVKGVGKILGGGVISNNGGTVIECGDISGTNSLNLEDAIISLKEMTGPTTGLIIADYVDSSVDVNNDDRLGIAETIYILHRLSE